jgi:hypothetical protein
MSTDDPTPFRLVPSEPIPSIVESLERALAQAKEGKVRAMAMVLDCGDGTADTFYDRGGATAFHMLGLVRVLEGDVYRLGFFGEDETS